MVEFGKNELYTLQYIYLYLSSRLVAWLVGVALVYSSAADKIHPTSQLASKHGTYDVVYQEQLAVYIANFSSKSRLGLIAIPVSYTHLTLPTKA